MIGFIPDVTDEDGDCSGAILVVRDVGLVGGVTVVVVVVVVVDVVVVKKSDITNSRSVNISDTLEYIHWKSVIKTIKKTNAAIRIRFYLNRTEYYYDALVYYVRANWNLSEPLPFR